MPFLQVKSNKSSVVPKAYLRELIFFLFSFSIYVVPGKNDIKHRFTSPTPLFFRENHLSDRFGQINWKILWNWKFIQRAFSVSFRSITWINLNPTFQVCGEWKRFCRSTAKRQRVHDAKSSTRLMECIERQINIYKFTLQLKCKFWKLHKLLLYKYWCLLILFSDDGKQNCCNPNFKH